VPNEEKVKISKMETPINIMIIDETSGDWRFWKACTRVLSRPNDLALRVYAKLLERQEQISSRDLAALVDAPLYSVRRALADLYELGIVTREHLERGHMTFDNWRVKTPILGILRLIPEAYFQERYPTDCF